MIREVCGSSDQNRMDGMRTLRTATVSVFAFGVFGVGPFPIETRAQTSDDITAVMQIESAGQPAMEMEYFLAQNRMRMDMSAEMSIISVSGDDPRMLMVQHPDQRYIEWGAQQLQMMQQMMQQMPNAGAGQGGIDYDPTQLQFSQTGETAKIGPWNAFEVDMADSTGNRGSLWLTTDTNVGLLEVMGRVASAAGILSSPMAGGGGVALPFLQFQAFAQAQGLPDGRVIRIVSDDDNGSTVITLTGVESGSISDDVFEPPANYTPIEIPTFPGLGL